MRRDYMHIPSEDTPGLAIEDRSGLGDAASDWAALARLTPEQRQQLVDAKAAQDATNLKQLALLSQEQRTQLVLYAVAQQGIKLPPMGPTQQRFFVDCIGGKTDPFTIAACTGEALKVAEQWVDKPGFQRPRPPSQETQVQASPPRGVSGQAKLALAIGGAAGVGLAFFLRSRR